MRTKPFALVDYAIGSGDRGLTLVGRDEEGIARELRLSHYNDGADWDVTIGQRAGLKNAADYLGLTLAADELNTCVHCHTTNSRAAPRGSSRLSPTTELAASVATDPAGTISRRSN